MTESTKGKEDVYIPTFKFDEENLKKQTSKECFYENVTKLKQDKNNADIKKGKLGVLCKISSNNYKIVNDFFKDSSGNKCSDTDKIKELVNLIKNNCYETFKKEYNMESIDDFCDDVCKCLKIDKFIKDKEEFKNILKTELLEIILNEELEKNGINLTGESEPKKEWVKGEITETMKQSTRKFQTSREKLLEKKEENKDVKQNEGGQKKEKKWVAKPTVNFLKKIKPKKIQEEDKKEDKKMKPIESSFTKGSLYNTISNNTENKSWVQGLENQKKHETDDKSHGGMVITN